MTAALLYRASSVLLVLFALGHQFGFRHVDPTWKADAAVNAMQSTQFHVQGFDRNYWAFFSGFGFFVTVLLLFSAVLAWQLGGAGPDTLRLLSLSRWALAASYVLIAFMTWRYFFMAPGIFATLVAICLILGAVARR